MNVVLWLLGAAAFVGLFVFFFGWPAYLIFLTVCLLARAACSFTRIL